MLCLPILWLCVLARLPCLQAVLEGLAAVLCMLCMAHPTHTLPLGGIVSDLLTAGQPRLAQALAHAQYRSSSSLEAAVRLMEVALATGPDAEWDVCCMLWKPLLELHEAKGQPGGRSSSRLSAWHVDTVLQGLGCCAIRATMLITAASRMCQARN